MNGNPAPFGALLIRFRAAAGLTQEQLAARAGLSRNAIAALERGRRHTPRGATAALLADALGLDDQVRTQFVAAARDTVGSGGTGGIAGTEGAGATERSSAAM
ncbi:MAG TPA: helix-turn-helix transcriptional regulator, partial [Ktedonobacterales bacterium]|nr:helix-turn-helix transcriptional regulator [Ktedonobacterales bacterium]